MLIGSWNNVVFFDCLTDFSAENRPTGRILMNDYACPEIHSPTLSQIVKSKRYSANIIHRSRLMNRSAAADV